MLTSTDKEERNDFTEARAASLPSLRSLGAAAPGQTHTETATSCHMNR